MKENERLSIYSESTYGRMLRQLESMVDILKPYLNAKEQGYIALKEDIINDLHEFSYTLDQFL